MKAAGYAIVLVAIVTAAVTWVAYQYRVERFRYRMVVEVETPSGIVRGASVNETGVRYALPIMMYGSANRNLTEAEAVPVDLPDGQTLFALLMGDIGQFYIAERAHRAKTIDPPLRRLMGAEQLPGLAEGARIWAEARRTRSIITLPAEHYPTLARFENTNEPSSIREVDPADLSASLGPNVRLRRIFVEMTDEPLTDQMSVRLPWLALDMGWLEKNSGRGGKARPFAQQVGGRHFVYRSVR